MSNTCDFQEPFDLFANWLEKAKELEPRDHNAMTVATTTTDGKPSARMVLLKDWDQDGFVFYTNFDSRKGQQLQNNMQAALLFHWKSMNRQIRIEGPVEVVSDELADDYFNSRPRDSRIGAWASQQSRPMEGRWVFEKEIAKYAAKYAVGDIPRPPHWSGFRVKPHFMEFWQDRKFRLHDRHIYLLNDEKNGWTKEVWFP